MNFQSLETSLLDHSAVSLRPEKGFVNLCSTLVTTQPAKCIPGGPKAPPPSCSTGSQESCRILLSKVTFYCSFSDKIKSRKKPIFFPLLVGCPIIALGKQQPFCSRKIAQEHFKVTGKLYLKWPLLQVQSLVGPQKHPPDIKEVLSISLSFHWVNMPP